MTKYTISSARLIGIGEAPTILAREIEPGMVRVYNYGIQGLITRVTRDGNTVSLHTRENDKAYEQRHNATRNVPILMENGQPVRRQL